MFSVAARRLSGKLSLAILALFAASETADAQDSVKVKRKSAGRTQLVNFDQATPQSANPYLGFLPAGATPDWAYWNAWLKDRGQKRAATLPNPPKLINASESESNNTRATADPITGFGTAGDPAANVTGTIPAPPAPTTIGPFAEDDGDIPAASVTGLTSGNAVEVNTNIGNGPHGSGGTGNGDYDFYRIDGVAVGDIILADIDTPSMGATGLDSFLSIFDSSGNLLAFNDDQDLFGGNFDSFVQTTASATGTYYICVGSFISPFPLDPFDSDSGFGVDTEGTYSITIGLNASDQDYFAIELEAGDIIGANVLSAGTHITLFDPSGAERIGSGQDLAGAFPGASTLPTGGNASLAYVVDASGTYTVRVFGVTGSYTVQLRAFRPVLESSVADTEQILFIDFNGATINTSIFGSPGNAVLSPLSAFLTRWGLTAGDLNNVIDSIMASVQENLETDLLMSGLNSEFGIDIRNSRDHADPFGLPNVSRIIVGGTIAQSGIETIGIAESIDVGNFEPEESALVLLDLLSEDDSDLNSLNGIPLGGGATIIDLIGEAVGNITAHEAGHYFGSFHTDNQFTPPNIMDQGGFLENTIGLGIDFTFGTGDDIDNDFGPDTYVASEGFTGTEDTLNTTAFGLYSTFNFTPSTMITSAPSLGFIAEGRPLTLRAPAGSGGPFQWQRDLGMGLEPVVDDARINGAATDELTFAPILETDAGVYFVDYEDGSKAAVTSSPFVLSVLPFGSLPAAGLAGLVGLSVGLVTAAVASRQRRRHRS